MDFAASGSPSSGAPAPPGLAHFQQPQITALWVYLYMPHTIAGVKAKVEVSINVCC